MITGADEIYVYHGGDYDYYSDVNVAKSLSLDDACVLAAFAMAIGDSDTGGILASTSTGVVTDASWKCNSNGPTNWHMPDFDDAAWSQALVMAPNDGSSWPVINGISAEAKWIWSQDTSTISAYCRKTLC